MVNRVSAADYWKLCQSLHHDLRSAFDGLACLQQCLEGKREICLEAQDTRYGIRLTTVCLQMWKKYIPNAKVSYLEYDAPCATKHKTEIEATAGGTLYIGQSHSPPPYSDLSLWLSSMQQHADSAMQRTITPRHGRKALSQSTISFLLQEIETQKMHTPDLGFCMH